MPNLRKFVPIGLTLILALGLSMAIALGKQLNPKSSSRLIASSANTPRKLSDNLGEKISYDIRLGNIYLGSAEFENMGIITEKNNHLCLVTINTNLGRFVDHEKIFSDPYTLLPIRVERNILNWLIRERITEDYNQLDFSVTITKSKGYWKDKVVIKKNSVIHNSVLLPYMVRYMPDLSLGKTIIANLPSKRLEIKLIGVENIQVAAGRFKAYHFVSIPRQIDIWISADNLRLPLMIKDKGAFGYCMSMRAYSFPLTASKRDKAR